MKPFARILLTLLLALPLCAAQAQTPERMQYQGYLTDLDGTPIQCGAVDDCPSGPYSLTMRLYDVPTGLPCLGGNAPGCSDCGRNLHGHPGKHHATGRR